MYKKLIEQFLSRDTSVSDYREGVRLLKRSGFLEVLRRGGYPSIINNGSDLNAMAHEGSWSNGYQTAVNQLEYLEELYANKVNPNAPRVTPTFGGEKIAEREGYLTKEELKTYK